MLTPTPSQPRTPEQIIQAAIDSHLRECDEAIRKIVAIRDAGEFEGVESALADATRAQHAADAAMSLFLDVEARDAPPPSEPVATATTRPWEAHVHMEHNAKTRLEFDTATRRLVRHHVDPNPDDSGSSTLTTCQTDSSVTGGPRGHSTAVGILHTRYADNNCYDSGVCRTHIPTTVAFIVNEHSGENFDSPNSLRAISWSHPSDPNAAPPFDLWERAY